jgi:hypothetical protein
VLGTSCIGNITAYCNIAAYVVYSNFIISDAAENGLQRRAIQFITHGKVIDSKLAHVVSPRK